MNKYTTLFKGFICLCLILCLILVVSSCKNRGSSGTHKTKNQIISTDSEIALAPTKANYNIYIENSGSMDGYVSTESDFKNSVYGITTKLFSKEIANEISLNFVSDKICEVQPKALSTDIQYFIYNLNAIKKANKKNCEVKSSDLPNIILNVLKAGENEVNILVSDCIFSLDKKSGEFLTQQQNSVNLLLAPELRKNSFSTIILKFNSQYKGNYYIESKGGIGVPFLNNNYRRPYYILIFGKPAKVNTLLSGIDFSEFKGFENSYYLLNPSDSKPSAKIVRNNLIGQANIAQPASKLIINNAKESKRNEQEGIFQFSIAVNLEFLKMNETYLDNPTNYEISDNYSIVSISRNKDLTNESLKEYTHVFTIKTKNLIDRQDISIKLRSKLPEWVEKSSNIDDSDPYDSIQQRQTFGLSYLIRGISDAYKDVFKDKGQFSLVIKVSKDNYSSHGSSSKFPWWVIFILITIVSIIIWLKNKK